MGERKSTSPIFGISAPLFRFFDFVVEEIAIV